MELPHQTNSGIYYILMACGKEFFINLLIYLKLQYRIMI